VRPGTAMMFQSCALFPHLNCLDNDAATHVRSEADADYLRRVTAEGCCGRDIAIAASCRRAACPLSSRASIAYRIGTKE